VLVQPARSLAQLIVKMLPRIPEFTSNPHLQEHLTRAALHFIMNVDKQPEENEGQTLQSMIKVLIPMLPLWASPESPPEDLGYSDIGLPPLEPKLMQAKVLALIMPVVEMHALFQSSPVRESCVEWFQSRPALESCLEWFVNSTQRCMAAAHAPIRPDDRWLTCNTYIAPYLKLLSEMQLLCLLSMFASNTNRVVDLHSSGKASGLHNNSNNNGYISFRLMMRWVRAGQLGMHMQWQQMLC